MVGQHEQQEQNGLNGGQRLLWLALAMVALSVPLWYEIAAQPGSSVFAWRWTEHQALVESVVSVLHLVIVVIGVLMLKKAVSDMPQWPLIRIGAWIWAALVAVFAIFSIVMYNIGENRVLESVEGEGYRVNFVRIAGTSDENQQMSVVMSCNHTLLYKRVLYVDRLAGVSGVDVQTANDLMAVTYLNNGEVLREETYSISDFYERCRNNR